MIIKLKLALLEMSAHFRQTLIQPQKSKEPTLPLDQFMSYETVYPKVSLFYEKLIFTSFSYSTRSIYYKPVKLRIDILQGRTYRMISLVIGFSLMT